MLWMSCKGWRRVNALMVALKFAPAAELFWWSWWSKRALAPSAPYHPLRLHALHVNNLLRPAHDFAFTLSFTFTRVILSDASSFVRSNRLNQPPGSAARTSWHKWMHFLRRTRGGPFQNCLRGKGHLQLRLTLQVLCEMLFDLRHMLCQFLYNLIPHPQRKLLIFFRYDVRLISLNLIICPEFPMKFFVL